MKITGVRVFRLEGGTRGAEALYETARGGLRPYETGPHHGVFTQIDTDEGLFGLSYGGPRQIKEAGRLALDKIERRDEL